MDIDALKPFEGKKGKLKKKDGYAIPGQLEKVGHNAVVFRTPTAVSVISIDCIESFIVTKG